MYLICTLPTHSAELLFQLCVVGETWIKTKWVRCRHGAGAGWGGTGELELIWCDAPSPVLVVTELRELVFQPERPTCKHTKVRVRSMLAFLASPRVCWSRPVHLIFSLP